VESQLLLFDAGEFADVFTGPEFTLYPRLFLECDLRALPSVEPAIRSVGPELELTPWIAQDYQAAGELVYACYVGHADARINDQYRSLHGSLRFLHNIVRFPGCGIFEANFSWMLRDRVRAWLLKLPTSLSSASRRVIAGEDLDVFCCNAAQRLCCKLDSKPSRLQ
jgi:hypothetical protein